MDKKEFEKQISPMGLDSLRELCLTGGSSYRTYQLNAARYALEDLIEDGGHDLARVPGYSGSMTPSKGIPVLIKFIQQTPSLSQSADFLAKESFGEVQAPVSTMDKEHFDKVQPEVTDSTKKIEESLDNSIDDSTATEPEEGQEDVQHGAGDDEGDEQDEDFEELEELEELISEFAGTIRGSRDCDCAAHRAIAMDDFVTDVESSIAYMNGAFDFETGLDGVSREVEDGVRSALYGLADLKMVLARVQHTVAHRNH